MAFNTFVSLDQFVDVTSTSVQDVFSLAKLPTLAITEANTSIPQEEFTEIIGTTQAQAIFGIDSPVSKFANVHFGVISKAATKVDRMFVYNWAKDGQHEAIRGGAITNAVMQLNGGFGISINGTVEQFEVDLTGSISFAEVASKLQTEIRTSTNPVLATATVTYSTVNKGFILITSGDLEEYNILFVEGATNDIHNKLGFTTYEGGKNLPMLPSLTFEEVLARIKVANGAYYLITPLFEFSVDDTPVLLKALGEWTHNSNNRFASLYSWKNKALLDVSSGATVPYEGYNGLIIDYPVSDYQNGFISGLISAMNLSLVAGNYNIAWNDATIYSENALSEDAEYVGLKRNKGNSPVRTGILGQDDTIYMPGTILGSLTDSINVYVCNSYLKFAQQMAIYNMEKAQRIIALRGMKGIGTISLYLDEVYNNARDAEIIVAGAELTTTERASVISNFPKNPDKALENLYNFGYHYEVNRIDTVTKEMYITQVYMANIPVDRIIVNNYILGA